MFQSWHTSRLLRLDTIDLEGGGVRPHPRAGARLGTGRKDGTAETDSRSRSGGRRTMPGCSGGLRIENLVLIREAELELDPGLNAITGETGAGKTILSNAIGLLLGARGEAGLIGAGVRGGVRRGGVRPARRRACSASSPSCARRARTRSCSPGGSSPTAGHAPTPGGGARRARTSPRRSNRCSR